MQCVECDRPVRYDITSRCREHSLRYIDSGDFKREALPNGRCRHCGAPLPQSSKGRPYEKCQPCAKRWSSMYQSVRRTRSKPLANCCKLCETYFEVGESLSRTPVICESCKSTFRCIGGGGCEVRFPFKGQRCGGCTMKLTTQRIVRKNAERSQRAVERAKRPLPVCACGERCPTHLAKFCVTCARLARRESWRRADRKRKGLLGMESPCDTTGLLPDGSSCSYCGEVGVAMTLDHVVALNRGGIHERNNLVPACKPCNSSKQDLSVDEWLASGRPQAVKAAEYLATVPPPRNVSP
jgi:5-methylcytosine-specific restriction endonuclease McrA